MVLEEWGVSKEGWPRNPVLVEHKISYTRAGKQWNPEEFHKFVGRK